MNGVCNSSGRRYDTCYAHPATTLQFVGFWTCYRIDGECRGALYYPL